MNKITLFDTPYALARGLSELIVPAIQFLVKRGPLVVLSQEQINDLSTTKIYSSTPLSKLFQDIAAASKLSNFIFVNMTRFQDDIPVILAYDDIVVDGKAISTTVVPAQIQKCWINITPFTSNKDSYNGQLNLTDVSAFANQVVRAALCSTYNDPGLWLNPKLSAYVIECYALVIGHTLRQAFNLNYEEEKFVETLFAAYYAQLLGPETAPKGIPPLLMRCTFLGSAQDILGRLESIKPYREANGEDILTPYKICAILAKCGPSRMKTFSPQQLYRFTSASSVDSQTMLIAMDYPPYWAYQMLRSVSGYKNPLFSTVMKMNIQLKNHITQFATELQTSGAILTKLTRG